MGGFLLKQYAWIERFVKKFPAPLEVWVGSYTWQVSIIGKVYKFPAPREV